MMQRCTILELNAIVAEGVRGVVFFFYLLVENLVISLTLLTEPFRVEFINTALYTKIQSSSSLVPGLNTNPQSWYTSSQCHGLEALVSDVSCPVVNTGITSFFQWLSNSKHWYFQKLIKGHSEYGRMTHVAILSDHQLSTDALRCTSTKNAGRFTKLTHWLWPSFEQIACGINYFETVDLVVDWI